MTSRFAHRGAYPGPLGRSWSTSAFLVAMFAPGYLHKHQVKTRFTGSSAPPVSGWQCSLNLNMKIWLLFFSVLATVARAEVTEMSLGVEHTCALTGGVIKCWGRNHKGQLGDETYTDSNNPVEVSGITTATSIALGDFHSCALLTGGSVKCWGMNNRGQLGDGTSGTDRNTPVPVLDITNVTSIALGGDHSCALLTDGSIKCWGKNDFGQLGDGSRTDRLTPVGGPVFETATKIAAGNYHVCVVLMDGTLRCWGMGDWGRLGDGTVLGSRTYRNTPVEVDSITTARDISLGEHSCAVLNNGEAKCWGHGGFGRLGNGQTSHAYSPVPVSEITTATSIAVGREHSCALLTGGKVKCWGTNSNGQLGDGISTGITLAVDVSGITAMSIASGWYYSCAVLTDGSVKCWGKNSFGQLGDGTTTQRTTPVNVLGSPCDASAAPTNGAVGDCTSSLASWSTCQPTCDAEYTVSGTSSCSLGTLRAATCSANPCDASTAPTNGAVGDCTSTLASGSTCQPTCDAGYTASGTSSCSAGTLTAATCSVSPCDASGAITNGAPGSGCTSTLAHGSSCTPTCNTGYTLSGTRSCTAGALTDNAACTATPCDASAAPTNGAVGTCTNSLASGASCSPTCDSGYTLSGTISCSAGTLTDTAVCSANSPASPLKFSFAGAAGSLVKSSPVLGGLQATPQGSPRYDDDGFASFDGIDDWIDLGDIQDLSPPFTLTSWLKPEEDRNWQRVFDFGVAQETNVFCIAQHAYTKTSCRLVVPGMTHAVDVSNCWTKGVWTHFAMAIDSAGFSLYKMAQRYIRGCSL